MREADRLYQLYQQGFITQAELIQSLDKINMQRDREHDKNRMRNEEFRRKRRRDMEFMQKKQAEREAMSEETRILYYAGIGSRNTPDYVLALMEQLACKLREDRMILRTGHAPGADQAFERGAGGAAQIFLPWRTFEQDSDFSASRNLDAETGEPCVVRPKIYDGPHPDTFGIAAGYHPAWGALSQGAQKLHARNVHQILGPDPLARPTPVEFVLCWTPGGEDTGGTGQALRIARDLEIPVYNLFTEENYDMAFEWAWGDDA